MASRGKPRMAWMSRGSALKLQGIAAIVLTLALCLPLPGLNVAPCAAMLILAVGIFRSDGFISCVGVAFGALGIAAAYFAMLMFGMA